MTLPHKDPVFPTRTLVRPHWLPWNYPSSQRPRRDAAPQPLQGGDTAQRRLQTMAAEEQCVASESLMLRRGGGSAITEIAVPVRLPTSTGDQRAEITRCYPAITALDKSWIAFCRATGLKGCCLERAQETPSCRYEHCTHFSSLALCYELLSDSELLRCSFLVLRGQATCTLRLRPSCIMWDCRASLSTRISSS